MKIHLMTFIGAMTLTVASLAQAQSREAAPATYNYDPDAYVSDFQPKSYRVDGFNFGFEYLSVDQSVRDIKTKSTGAVRKNVKANDPDNDQQWGLKIGYKQIPFGGFGFDLSASILEYEKSAPDEGDLVAYMPSANIVLAAPQLVYASAGLNTAVIAGSKIVKYSPRIGYQAGAGLILGNHFNLEVFYNWINTAIEEQYNWNEVRMTALNARMIYLF